MKRFLFACLGLMMILMAQAATYDVGQPPQSDQVLLMQSYDAPQMVADFVLVDYSADMIATAPTTVFVHYEAMDAEVYTQMFDFTLPVFRLCSHRANLSKSQIVNSWRWHNTNPPNQYDRA